MTRDDVFSNIKFGAAQLDSIIQHITFNHAPACTFLRVLRDSGQKTSQIMNHLNFFFTFCGQSVKCNIWLTDNYIGKIRFLNQGKSTGIYMLLWKL